MLRNDTLNILQDIIQITKSLNTPFSVSNHSIVTVKMEEKQPKPWGVLMDKQNHPIFPYRPPNLLVLKWAKKKKKILARIC